MRSDDVQRGSLKDVQRRLDLNKTNGGKVERRKGGGGEGWMDGWGMSRRVFLELRVGVGDVYNFRVTTGSSEILSSTMLYLPERSEPCTQETDSGTEERALSKKFAPSAPEEEEEERKRMPFGCQNFTTCPRLSLVQHAALC